MYFESIDDYKHLEMTCRRLNGTTSKFKYNPISITEKELENRTPTFDKLFDRGLITFSENGRIYFSSQLSESVIDKLHISEGDSFDLKISTELKQNLQYHQDVVFVTQKRGKAIWKRQKNKS